MSDKPIVFISHKHSDSKIAQALAAFCERKAGGRIQVFLSSNADFKGPRFGRNLNRELMKTLWQSDVLLLVYTSSDQDWSYCMWECGVASDSQSPETNLVIFQCGVETPSLFSDITRVNVREAEQIKAFVNQFLRDVSFFPSLKGTPLLSDYRDNYIADDSKELYDNLASVLPKDGGPSQEWPTWPYLRIELPQGEVDRMQQASDAERVALANQLVKDFGVVVD